MTLSDESDRQERFEPPIPSASVFDGLLPEGAVAVEARSAHLWESGLFPEEEELVTNAVPKRRREFIAGRNCARLALERLGIAPQAIGVGAFREPLFPLGISGTITHTQNYCAAAVVRTAHIISIGIDAETNESLTRFTADLVMNDDERKTVQAFDRSWCADKLIFSAKESFFKAVFPVVRQYLEFSDAIVSLSPKHHGFGVRVVSANIEARLGQTKFVGRYRFEDGLIFTTASLVDANCRLEAQPVVWSGY